MALAKTHQQFRDALAVFDADHPLVARSVEGQRTGKTRRALFAAWWFIENVSSDDPARTGIFFELREIVREAA